MPDVHAAPLDVRRNRVLWRFAYIIIRVDDVGVVCVCVAYQIHLYRRLCDAILPIDEPDDAGWVFRHMLTRLRRRRIVS